MTETRKTAKGTAYNRLPLIILGAAILLKLLISLYPYNYGVFRDELYFNALSDRPDYGYMEVPPLAPLLLAIVKGVFGFSFFSLHIIPALFGIITLIITYSVVSRLGGGWKAQLLALAAVLLAPQFVADDALYTYETFDKLFWLLSGWALFMRIVKSDTRYWILFGLFAGLGLLSKPSILFFGLAVVLALPLVTIRRDFLKPHLWLGGAIALVLFLPYLVWQVRHGFPIVEFYSVYGAKSYSYTLPEFLKNLILTANPMTFFLWFGGVVSPFLRGKSGEDAKALRTMTIFSIMFAFILILGVCTKVKYYLVLPLFPLFFAFGGVLFEKSGFPFPRKAAVVYAMLILMVGLLVLPFARPVMAPEKFIAYASAIGMGPDAGVKAENLAIGALPQNLADMFGWKELAAKVAGVYDSLSPGDKKEAAVLTANYGEAGAIHLYGKAYGLPEPISGHQQYFLWGPGKANGNVVIVVGMTYNDLIKGFEEVTLADRTDARFTMPYEYHLSIWICRKIREPLAKIWPLVKNYN